MDARLRMVLWPVRLGVRVVRRLKRALGLDCVGGFLADWRRFCSFAGGRKVPREGLEAEIIMVYHVVEKGLTMPDRRLGFGQGMVQGLMAAVERFAGRYPLSQQVSHAIGVVKAYRALHVGFDWGDGGAFWGALERFVERFAAEPLGEQVQTSREAFFAARSAAFPAFAASRHTVRHYGAGQIPMAVIEAAVRLAQTAPSACNRQHARVYCIAERGVAVVRGRGCASAERVSG